MATKKTAQKKGQSNKMIALEVGAGVLAAAAAGAGYYFYGDKKAKQHRQAASAWAKKMKAQVVKEAKTLSKFEQKSVAALVDRAAKTYESVKNIDKKDLAAAAKELKMHWKELEKEVSAARTSVSKTVAKKVATSQKQVAKNVAQVKKALTKKPAAKKGAAKK